MNRRNRRAIANSIWWFIAGPAVPGSILGLVETLDIGSDDFLGPTHLVLIAACVFWGLSWFGIFFYWIRRFVEGNDSDPDSPTTEASKH